MRCNGIVTIVKLASCRVGIALALHWHCIGIALALHWHCIGIALALHWHCIGIALALHWHCIGISNCHASDKLHMAIALRSALQARQTKYIMARRKKP
jgi:hypothetical protein